MRLLIFFVIFISCNFVKAEFIKPNNNLLPNEIISIQLTTLQKNNIPYENAGIEQTWEFAHPSNRKFTGPLSNFISMMYSKKYQIMLNHRTHNIILVKKKFNISYFFIELVDKYGNQFGFQWTVEKVLIDDEYKDCWMTAAVSLPIQLAKSA